MKLIWLYFLAFLLLPIVGEIFVYTAHINISAGNVSVPLIVNNLIFALIMIGTTFFVSNYKFSNRYVPVVFDYGFSKKILIKIVFVYLLIDVIAFALSGYRFLIQHYERGYIRTHLGIFGPLFTLLLGYFSFFLVIYGAVVYKYTMKKDFLIRFLMFTVFVLSVILGLFSGYKAVALSIIIAGVSFVYFNGFSVWKTVLFVVFSFLILIFFTSLVRGENFYNSFYFVLYRMTVMSAYGSVGVWNQFHSPVDFDGFMHLVAGMFGNKAASVILGESQHSVDFLKTSLSRYVTYLVYPNTQGALNGSVNVTVSAFGHAVYLFGKYLYFLYALLMGVLIGVVFRKLKEYFYKGLPFKTSFIAVFFFSVIIPSLNSSGLFGIINIYVIIYLLAVYLISIVMFKKIKRYDLCLCRL